MALSREMKVGLFVFLGLLGAAALIFVIGDNKSLFDRKVTYLVQFEDVQGVKPGSTVRMGGVDIGTVSSVQYPEVLAGEPRIDVQLQIVRREAHRIRQSSEASIAAKGLLGDKMVTISPGHPDEPPVPPGGVLRSAPAQDFTEMLSRVDAMAGTAQNVLANLETATSTLADRQLQKDLRDGVAALSHILVAIDSGGGYASKLLNDRKEAERLSNVMANLEQTSARLDQVLAGVDRIIDQINQGPGLAHEVLYGQSGARAVAQVGGAAEELGKVLAGVRGGNGLAHGLLFGDTGAGGDSVIGDKVADDLTAMSSDLRAIVSGIREGKGTLGALMVDPSVYEDLKMLLGNVQRNQVLRALVRYSIQRDERPGVEVVDPEAPSRPASGEGGEKPKKAAASRQAPASAARETR